jgi:hypothetical protein
MAIATITAGARSGGECTIINKHAFRDGPAATTRGSSILDRHQPLVSIKREPNLFEQAELGKGASGSW